MKNLVCKVTRWFKSDEISQKIKKMLDTGDDNGPRMSFQSLSEKAMMTRCLYLFFFSSFVVFSVGGVLVDVVLVIVYCFVVTVDVFAVIAPDVALILYGMRRS